MDFTGPNGEQVRYKYRSPPRELRGPGSTTTTPTRRVGGRSSTTGAQVRRSLSPPDLARTQRREASVPTSAPCRVQDAETPDQVAVDHHHQRQVEHQKQMDELLEHHQHYYTFDSPPSYAAQSQDLELVQNQNPQWGEGCQLCSYKTGVTADGKGWRVVHKHCRQCREKDQGSKPKDASQSSIDPRHQPVRAEPLVTKPLDSDPGQIQSHALPNVHLVEKYEGIIATLEQQMKEQQQEVLGLRKALLLRYEEDATRRPDTSTAAAAGGKVDPKTHQASSVSQADVCAAWQSSCPKCGAHLPQQCLSAFSPNLRDSMDRHIEGRLHKFSEVVDDNIARAVAQRLKRITAKHVGVSVDKELQRQIDQQTTQPSRKVKGDSRGDAASHEPLMRRYLKTTATWREDRDFEESPSSRYHEADSALPVRTGTTRGRASRARRASSPPRELNQNSSPTEVETDSALDSSLVQDLKALRHRIGLDEVRVASSGIARAAPPPEAVPHPATAGETDTSSDTTTADPQEGLDVAGQLKTVVKDLEKVERSYERDRLDQAATVSAPQLTTRLGSPERPRSPEPTVAVAHLMHDVDYLLHRLRSGSSENQSARPRHKKH